MSENKQKIIENCCIEEDKEIEKYEMIKNINLSFDKLLIDEEDNEEIEKYEMIKNINLSFDKSFIDEEEYYEQENEEYYKQEYEEEYYDQEYEDEEYCYEGEYSCDDKESLYVHNNLMIEFMKSHSQ